MALFEAHGVTDVQGTDQYNACYGGTAALLNCFNWVRTRMLLRLTCDIWCTRLLLWYAFLTVIIECRPHPFPLIPQEYAALTLDHDPLPSGGELVKWRVGTKHAPTHPSCINLDPQTQPNTPTPFPLLQGESASWDWRWALHMSPTHTPRVYIFGPPTKLFPPTLFFR
jgi:hypothetical protein